MAAITGLLLYKKYKLIAAKYFIYFLVYLSVCDFIGTYTYYIDDNGALSFLKGTLLEKNNWWTTLYWKMGAVLFFAFYYQKILKERLNQSIVRKLSYFFIIKNKTLAVLSDLESKWESKDVTIPMYEIKAERDKASFS